MDPRLEQALAENRRRVVKRVLEHCGYRVDDGTPGDPAPVDCLKQERQTLRDGSARLSLRRLWARLRGHGGGRCPSLWSGLSPRAWWRHRR